MTTAVADPAYRIRSAHYTVPSHTTPGKTYRVDVDPADGLPVPPASAPVITATVAAVTSPRRRATATSSI